jgi:acyl carrier protein
MRPDVERAVRAEILRLLEQLGKPVAAVSAGDALSESLGLTSLDVVELITTLNAQLGVDPFMRRAFTEIQTVGDLARAYALPPAAGASDAELAVSRRRAEARRDRWSAQA